MATQKCFGAKMYFRLTFYVIIYIIMKWVYKVCSRSEKIDFLKRITSFYPFLCPYPLRLHSLSKQYIVSTSCYAMLSGCLVRSENWTNKNKRMEEHFYFFKKGRNGKISMFHLWKYFARHGSCDINSMKYLYLATIN